MKISFPVPLGFRIVALSWFLLFLCLALFPLLTRRPVKPVSSPPELFTMQPCFSDINEPDLFGISQGCLLAYQPTPVHVQFPVRGQIESAAGYWYGENAFVVINGDARTFEGTPIYTSKYWHDIITVGSDQPATSIPWTVFNTNLQLDAKDVHQKLHMSASMDVTYPALHIGGYTDVQQHLAENYTVFVVTPEELAFRRDSALWNGKDYLKNKRSTSECLVVIGVLGALFIYCVGCVYKMPGNARRRRPPPPPHISLNIQGQRPRR
jgi:hypothetical protein